MIENDGKLLIGLGRDLGQPVDGGLILYNGESKKGYELGAKIREPFSGVPLAKAGYD